MSVDINIGVVGTSKDLILIFDTNTLSKYNTIQSQLDTIVSQTRRDTCTPPLTVVNRNGK